MSYAKNEKDALAVSCKHAIHTCPVCGEKPQRNIVWYDFNQLSNDHGPMTTVWFHRECASLLGQRLICDAFPNRYDEQPLT
jgi:hypothetical protein